MVSRFLSLKAAFTAIKDGRPEEAAFSAETFLTPKHKEMNATNTAEITSRYGELIIDLDDRTHELFAKHHRAHMLTCGEAAAGHIEDMTKGLSGAELIYTRAYQKLHILEKFLATPLEPYWNERYDLPDAVYEIRANQSAGSLLVGIRGRSEGGGPTKAQQLFLDEHNLSLTQQ